MLQAMASFINSTSNFINDAYDYYLWTLSLAGNLWTLYFAFEMQHCNEYISFKQSYHWSFITPLFQIVLELLRTKVNTMYLRFSDERTKGWLLVDSPKPTLIYTAIYLFIVWVGPKIMKKRRAFKLTWALVPYNLAMAYLNAYIAIQVNISCLCTWGYSKIYFF